MKKIFNLLAVLVAFTALSSCNKMGTTYYMYNIDEHLTWGTDSPTNIDAINEVLGTKQAQYGKLSKAKAKAEWNSFVKAVDDSKVIIGTDEEYYSVSFVKVVATEKGDYDTESNVVEVIGKKTWRKSGAIEE